MSTTYEIFFWNNGDLIKQENVNNPYATCMPENLHFSMLNPPSECNNLTIKRTIKTEFSIHASMIEHLYK